LASREARPLNAPTSDRRSVAIRIVYDGTYRARYPCWSLEVASIGREG
jgi:hypothetical protein